MILEVEDTTITEVSYWNIVKYYPLSPVRQAIFTLRDTNGAYEIFVADDIIHMAKIVGVKSKRLEKW